MVGERTEETRKRRAAAFGLLLAALMAASLLLAPRPAYATTFTVDHPGDNPDLSPGNGVCAASTNQTQKCTLRAAIEEANATAEADTIGFNIPDSFGTGVKTIRPNSPLPKIEFARQLTINGYTQPGASPNSLAQGTNAVLRIELSGENAGAGGVVADGLVIEASDSVVRGLVINRFGGTGIVVRGEGNRIEGNFVGTNPSGTIDRGNRFGGVTLNGAGASANTVGGTTPDRRNLISGNDREGVVIFGGTNNVVQANLIGTEKDGTSALGNDEEGIEVAVSNNNIVGGNTVSAANTIAFNGQDGVEVDGSSSTANRILRNSIFSNVGLGIDLNSDGPTANDPQDPDVGANNLQNTPVLTSATTSGDQTIIRGGLNSIPGRTFTVQFFSDISGGEGKTFLGERTVFTDVDGDASFEFTAASALFEQEPLITATATSTGGDTSEFSVPREAVPKPAATFTVNFADDFADADPNDDRCDVNVFLLLEQCTLRAAIEEANDTAAADTINFNIGGVTDVRTISPNTELPPITNPLTIDGYTQPGASPNTKAVGNDAVLKVELNGQGAGTSANGLTIAASNVVIKGLAINRFKTGIRFVPGATGNRLEGNFVGTDATGTRDLGNDGFGVFIRSANNTVGGTSPAARNVVSGNGDIGVELGGTNNKALGNYIGTNATGTQALGNVSGVGIGGSGNTVGGVEAGTGNVISGNSREGVVLVAAGSEVQGNLVGTDATGTEDLGNGGAGVVLTSGASDNTVGGVEAGASNVISGNDGNGVLIFDGTNNRVQGNLIGTEKGGATALGNSLGGVAVGPPGNIGGTFNASGNLVGGTVSEATNTIAFNSGDGVRVTSNGSTGNRILSNSIFSNADLGIDLADDGPTANDFGDLDTGPNNLQNFPELSSARTAPGGSTIVEGSLRSAPGETYTLRFFSGPPNSDEGKTFVAQRGVATNADGVASFTFAAGAVPVGRAITTTATSSDGDTSEFSGPRAVVDGVPPNTTITSGPAALTRSTSATFRFSSSEAGSKFQCSLDGRTFALCSSPKRLSNLKSGRHTFKVRARDAAGNVDPTPATRRWTVDALKPTVTRESPEDGSSTRDRTPLIGATVRDNLTNLSKSNIQLFVDGRRISTFSYSSATDRLSLTSKRLAVGRHTVKVVATDKAGNVASRQWTFRVVG